VYPLVLFLVEDILRATIGNELDLGKILGEKRCRLSLWAIIYKIIIIKAQRAVSPICSVGWRMEIQQRNFEDRVEGGGILQFAAILL
jgi:hypothetical protein